ncbi:ATP-dependent metallopeptidase FtsH/Yme1/Tma family protein [[Clostridium] colinum]|uniref:ATP-dependent metallopeptidase FtsH/Yme1/Tma family protein n=1 Tax=[Clostridium] colinum TaxID=36835 RepID=UPI0020248D48|nr:AAA family ATPase [[Clostridium] colinum]
MKKINYKIICFVSLFIILLLGVSLKGKENYIPYPDFYSKACNKNIDTIFYNDSDKIKFKEKNNDTIFTTDNPRTEDFKENMLIKGIVFKEQSNITNSLYSVLAIFLIGATVFLIYKKTKKNPIAIKEFNIEDKNNIFFKDIAGNEEAKENAKDIVDFLKCPEKYKKLNARAPKGIIFYGEPGTGKTMLAKAIASEAGVPFYSVCGSDFVEMYVGVGASRVRALFKKARESKKAVIFIDEIDAIGKKRATSLQNTNEEREQTLNALLTEMSGFSSDETIIVIATTNRLDILDDALVRAGRFDRHIEIGLPDKVAREKILSLLLKNKTIDKNLNIKDIAKKTVYFSGAMLDALVNESSIMAIKDNNNEININHIDKAYLKIIAGDERKDTSFLTQQDKKITAIHEAGHAVVTNILNVATISKISILPTIKGAGGFCLNIFEDKLFKTKQDIENQIISLYGGRCAEEIMLGSENITTGAYNDIEKATKIIVDYVSKYGMLKDNILSYNVLKEDENIIKEYKTIATTLYEKAKNILIENKNTLEKLVDTLLEKETLNEEEIYHILKN